MDRAVRRGSRPLPKTYTRWLTATLLANGVSLPLPIDVATDVAEMLVATHRAVPMSKWVDHFIAKGRADRERNLPHNRL